MTASAKHLEVQRFKRQRGRAFDRLAMVDVQFALAWQEATASLATVIRLDAGNAACPLPDSRAVERGAVVGHGGQDTPCGVSVHTGVAKSHAPTETAAEVPG